MKRYEITIFFVLAGGLILFPFYFNSEAKSIVKFEAETQHTSASEKTQGSQNKPKTIFLSKPINYMPPLRASLGGRIGSGTRGETDESIFLSVLVPNHTGLTTSNQPMLYWYLASETSNRIEFTLNIEQEGKTVAQECIDAGVRCGIKRISLKDIGVTLLPDKEYTWFISMTVDPTQPSKNIFSGGTIRLISPTKTLAEKLTTAQRDQVPVIYAAQRIWYDALSAISALIDEEPESRAFHEQRARLLDQVGLHHAAKFDRKNSENP